MDNRRPTEKRIIAKPSWQSLDLPGAKKDEAEPKDKKRRVAIACQGGGSHTAFTAGVLEKILKEKNQNFEIVAFSGTSGGAICAFLTWYGLLLGRKDTAIDLLNAFWQAISVNSYRELYLNYQLVRSSRLRSSLIRPEVSPYSYSDGSQRQLKQILEKYVRFDKIKELLNKTSPSLLIGAVNVLSGQPKVFRNAEINVETILASTALPSLFRAVRVEQEVFWDGSFSQNPPLRELPEFKPDEIWLIQINPSHCQKVPRTAEEIRDRANQLSANLAVEQEIYFIKKINELVQAKLLPRSQFKQIEVKRITMLRNLGYSSKLDRRASFIKDLMAYGETRAEEFLKDYAHKQPT